MMKRILLVCLLGVSALADIPQSQWTFKAKNYKEKFATGLIERPKTMQAPIPSKEFLLRDGAYPKYFHLKDKAVLSPIKNQKSCGSCVYFATTSVFEDTLRIRGVVPPELAPQYLMDCGSRRWMCNGSLFEIVAEDLVKKKGQATEASYPYRASNQSCKGASQLHGKIESFKLIDNSPKSVIAALNAGYAVAVTVGAGGAWGSYRSGIFNACSRIGTNHQIAVVGYDCESAVDAQGNCKFDANGKLPSGVGIWYLRNSWGTGWGEEGWMRSKMTDSNGRLCNNVVEEAGILETGLSPEPPKPKVFVVPGKTISVKVTLSSENKLTTEQGKRIVKPFIDSLDKEAK